MIKNDYDLICLISKYILTGILGLGALFFMLTLMLFTADNLTGSIDEPVEDGDTALHLTCLYGHLACVQVYYLCLFIFLGWMNQVIFLFQFLSLLLLLNHTFPCNNDSFFISRMIHVFW